MNPIHIAKTIAAAALLSLLPASFAMADDKLHVVQPPTGEDVARFYPERSQRLEVEGKARVTCTADAAGALQQCVVVHEWPQRYGFGQAALAIAPSFRVSGPGPFTTTIAFRLGDDELFVPSETSRGRWLKVLARPGKADIAAAYPGDGTQVMHANLLCRLNASGTLAPCMGSAPDDDPKAVAAATKLAGLYRVTTPLELTGAKVPLLITLPPSDPEDAGK